MSIDPKFIELTADVFRKKIELLHRRVTIIVQV